jgi:ATP-binding cassette subfamily B protein
MKNSQPMSKLVELIRLERKDISNIYAFAILSGIIQLTLPLGVQSIIGFVLGGTLSTSLVILISLVILGVFLAGVFQIQQMKIVEKIQQKIYHKYAFLFKNSLMEADLKNTDDLYLPEMMNRFLDVSSLQKGFSKILLDIPLASIQIVLGLFIVAMYHPLFLILVFLMLIIIVIIFYLTSKKGLETSIKESSYKYATTGWLEEIARMIQVFKMSRENHYSLHRLDHKVINYLEYRTKHFSILLFQFKNLIALKIMITTAMLSVGTYLLINQQLNIGQFVAAELIILTIISSVEKVIVNLDTFYDLLTSLDKLHLIENQPKEHVGNSKLPLESNGMDIEFDDICYAYNDKINVFNGLSFSIEAGDKVAIDGKDGSGKSTLLRMLSSLYLPNSGSITYNKIPHKLINMLELRCHIGVMFNRLDIFNGSILDNIVLGNPNLKLEDIVSAAKKIGLYSFLSQHEMDLNSTIETTGKKLPRTILKKIMLLRATLGNPKLILLEEPFSDMDEHSLSAIKDYILHDIKGSTVVVISNDQEFNSRCNKVLFLENNSVKTIHN